MLSCVSLKHVDTVSADMPPSSMRNRQSGARQAVLLWPVAGDHGDAPRAYHERTTKRHLRFRHCHVDPMRHT